MITVETVIMGIYKKTTKLKVPLIKAFYLHVVQYLMLAVKVDS